MITHDLKIDENNIFRIEWGHFGKERYYLNNKLIHERLSLSVSGERLFDINVNDKPRKLKISYSIFDGLWKVNKVSAKAYLDDRLIEDDILKTLKKKWNKYNTAVNVILIISVLFMIITMYLYYS